MPDQFDLWECSNCGSTKEPNNPTSDDRTCVDCGKTGIYWWRELPQD